MTILYTTTITLPCDAGRAIIEITDHPPVAAPELASAWAESIDYPRAVGRVFLPRGLGNPIAGSDICNSDSATIRSVDGVEYRGPYHGRVAAAPRRADVVDKLRRDAESALAPIIAYLAAREARLALRERTLASGVA